MRHSVWIPAQTESEPSIRISELIALLSEIADKNGDLEVLIYNDEWREDVGLWVEEIKVIEAETEGWTRHDKHVSLGRYD
jgi:hypothetical protein